MKSKVRIKAENLSCFGQSIKLLYSGTGENSIDRYLNDRNLNQIDMNSDNWGGNFLDASGRVWVADGKTLPFAFNSAVNVIVRYIYGASLGITNLTSNVGESIDAFFVRIAEDMSSKMPDGNNLGGASPMGVQMYYSTESEVKMKPSMFNQFLTGFQVQDLSVPTTSFPFTNFTDTYPEAFSLKHPDGWNIDIMVVDSSSGDYREFVNSLLNQNIYLDTIRKYSNNSSQLDEPILAKRYDVAGFEKQLADTSVIDPYQYQKVLDYEANLDLNGQTYLEVKILAGEFLSLTLNYDKKVGVIGYDEIAYLDTLLKEQGIQSPDEVEQEELEDAFMNFSGFNEKQDKALKFTILGLLTYMVLKDL